MHAMVLDAPGRSVELRHLPRPEPGPDEILVRIAACAVCRTDLHVVDGELPEPKRPLIPGHEIVGQVAPWEAVFAILQSASEWAFPGWAGPVESAGTAAAATKIYVRTQDSLGIKSMGVMRNILLRMRVIVFV
jgi:hypothetical protein